MKAPMHRIERGCRGSAVDDWDHFRDAVHSSALKMRGLSTRKQHDWFDENDEEIQALLVEKHRLHRAHQNDPSSAAKKNVFTSARRIVQNKLRKMQDAWLSTKADEIQGYADRNDWKRFYEAFNTLYGSQSIGSSPLLGTDGTTLITEKAQILQRWAEHFEAVLSRPSSINDEAIDRIHGAVDINSTMDDPVVAEVTKAASQLSSGKATGADTIPAEIYKAGGPVLIEKLTKLFQSFWKQGSILQELKDASIVHLYKRKGNRQVCNNHRGVLQEKPLLESC
ncbi:uncharacterized protein [Mobula birostris]|uniref:uncharacterized protein n=1 Tax=Mobula birostris TaxID=1983395 RepID=UPI003B27BB9D